jgi:hypothetical protein
MKAYKIVDTGENIFFLSESDYSGRGSYQLSKMDLERTVVVNGMINAYFSNPPYWSPVVTFKKLDGREITF